MDDSQAVVLAGICFVWALTVAVAAFTIYCLWRICAKAGYSGAMSLLCLIPGIGAIVLLCVLAFGKWPAHSNSGGTGDRG